MSSNIKQALVIDADALNIIAESEQGVKHLPKGCIITPHPKEFERLFGKTGNDFERLDVAIQNAQSLGIFILLKGAHTCVACPNREVYFNSTGNPGMATAGSGDVLTGIITSLLAQGYSAKEAAILGAFLHGLAGDLSAKEVGQEALIASDIIEGISKAYQFIKNEKT
jgi:NAD(P)H-hydrate epimerase